MIVALIALSAALVVIGNFARMPWLNPITALVGPWLTVMLLASLPGALTPALTPGLWTLMLTGFMGTAVGALFGWFVGDTREIGSLVRPKVEIVRVARFHKILSAGLAVYGIVQAIDAWPILQRLGGVQAIFSPSAALGNEYKYQYSQDRLETTSAALDGSTFLTGSLGYILFLGHISLFTGAVLWRSGRRVLASVPLVVAAGYSLFSLQRTSFFMCFLIFATTVVYTKTLQVERGVVSPKKKTNRGSGRLAAVIVGCVLLVPVLLYPIQQRNNATQNSTGLQSLAQYLLSSIAGLNQRIDPNFRIAAPPAEISGAVAPQEGWGAYSFTGLYTLLKRAGVPVPVAPHAFDYYSAEIFGLPFSTNTGTSFLNFYLDFGWVGVAIMPFTMGLLASVALRHFLRGKIAALPYLVVLIVSIIWSFFVNALFGDFRYLYLTIIASIVLPSILYGYRPVWKLRRRRSTTGIEEVRQ